MIKKVIKKILYPISRQNIIYKIARKIIDLHRNENNCDIETNGELDFIKKNGKTFSTVFDVGANIGEWTKLVSEISPKSRIYSFEPSMQTFSLLNDQKFHGRVYLQKLGLGDKNEIKEMYINKTDSTLNSVFSRDLRFDDSGNDYSLEKTEFMTLDTFCEKNNITNISLLKIDTEGNEFSVLKGAEGCIKNKKIDAIQFEYGGTYIDARILLKDIFDFFKGSPYALYKMMPTYLKAYTEYSEDLENFQYSNWVALLKK